MQIEYICSHALELVQICTVSGLLWDCGKCWFLQGRIRFEVSFSPSICFGTLHFLNKNDGKNKSNFERRHVILCKFDLKQRLNAGDGV